MSTLSHTARQASAAARIEPIILEDANDHIAEALWSLLCDGNVDGWKVQLGQAGKGSTSFDDMVQAWRTALNAAAQNDALRDEALAILERLDRHCETVADHRSRYRFVSPEVARHRYWPTGKREHMERENLYTMSLCPQRHPLITRDTKIAVAGNCFAMNMGRWLRDKGYNYVVKNSGPTEMPEEERWRRKYGHYSVRQSILFNIPSIRQWAERGLGVTELRPYLWRQNDTWLDPYREEVPFDSPEEYAADMPRFLHLLRETLLEMDVLIISPAVNEVWRFLHDGSYLSRVPWQMSPALLERKVLTVQDNVNELQRLNNVLREYNPDIKIIMTVSPVPLLATFRSEEMNVVAANCHAKSVLRVAAEEFAHANDNVFYFPAYEAVMYCSKQPFAEDGRHVHPDAIEHAMWMFEQSYCLDEQGGE